MVREDIVAGLRNAVERGYSLEIAKQSFISAGYSAAEVEAAAKYISTGVLPTASPIPYQKQSQPNQDQLQGQTSQGSLIQQTTGQQSQQAQTSEQNASQQIQPVREFSQTPQAPPQAGQPFMNKPKKKIPWKLIILISVLAVLIGILIVTLVFKDNLVNLFS